MSLTRLLLVVLSALPMFGQTATATLSGVVTDETGGTVAGARIVLRNAGTGVERSGSSDGTGRYHLAALPVGEYVLQVEMSGFKTSVRAGLTLQVQQQATADVVLAVGEVTQRVEVSGSAQLVALESASNGTVVNNKLIVDLPLNGRNFLQLATLSAGVSDAVSHAQHQPGLRGAISSISTNGLRPELNNYLLDGVTNVDGNFNIIAVSPSIDALQEFKVQTNSYSAEFGRSPGAQINAVTKAGSNLLHGSLYEFLRNDKFDARNYFAPPTARKPPYRQNQFGGSLGGPVIVPKLYSGRNRTFFFFNYEGLRVREAQTLVSSVPIDQHRSGDFSTLGRPLFDPATLRANPNGSGFVRTPFPGNVIPPSRISPQGAGLLDYYPRPNLPGLVANYVDGRSSAVDSDQYTTRIDHVASPQDQFFFRYVYINQPITDPGRFESVSSQQLARPQNYALSYTRIFRPTLLNEAKFAFSRLLSSRFGRSALEGNDVTGNLGIIGFTTSPREYGLPLLSMTTLSGAGDADPFDQANNTFQFLDNLNWTNGRHNLRMGVEFRRFQFNIYAVRFRAGFGFDGRFTNDPQVANSQGSDVADLLLGHPLRADRTIGDVQLYARRSSYGFYLQDDWKVTRNLTLNLGLRYEYASPFVEKYDRLITAVVSDTDVTLVRAGTGDPYENMTNIRVGPGIPYVRDGRFGRTLTKRDLNNWAPRVGMAWDPLGTGRWSVRAGAGVFFAEDVANTLNDLTTNPPQGARQAPTTDLINPTLDIRNPFGDTPGFVLTITQPRIFSLAYDLVSPYVIQYSASVQRQLGQSGVIEIGYSGNQGHKISAFQVLNIAPPGPGVPQSRRIPSPLVGTVTPMAPLVNSNYHGLQVRMERRFSAGLTFIVAHTWGHAIDDGASRISVGNIDFAQNEKRRDLERASSDHDVRHATRFGGTYQLPFTPQSSRLLKAVAGGWQLGGFVNNLTSVPVSIRSIGDANTGVGGLRADYVDGTDPELPSDQRQPGRWFNTDAFRRPAPFTFGNVGRNTVKAPGRFSADVTLMKDFRFVERHLLSFRAESFNLTNTPNFDRPSNMIGNALFGRITSAQAARRLQFALKYSF